MLLIEVGNTPTKKRYTMIEIALILVIITIATRNLNAQKQEIN